MPESTEFQLDMVGDGKVSINRDQTILDASLDAGIQHFHACGGNGECSTCRVLIVEGLEHLSPVNEKEEMLRNRIPFPPAIRLACQTRICGQPVRAQRIILDKTDVSLHIRKKIGAEHRKLGEKKDLVLFFLDIRDFTPFVESFLPYDVIHVMRSCHIIFNHVITKYHGQIIDTAGDGFYAVFGLSSSRSEAADQSIQAGFDIMKEMVRYNETYLRPYFNTRFEIGIGVHAGEVIVGETQVGQKSHLSIMGIPVNIASRIQAITRKLNNSFLVSETVVDCSQYGRESEKRLVKLKGIREPMKVHTLGEGYENVILPANTFLAS